MAYVCPMTYDGMYFGGFIWIALVVAVVWLVITLINKNNIHLTTNSTEELSGNLYVCTLTGQKIYSKLLNTDLEMDISMNVPTGYYILYIVTNQYVYNKKILIIN